MKATKTIVLYDDTKIIAEVYAGETYLIPSNVQVYEGTKEQFLLDHPAYTDEQFNEYTEVV